MDLFIKRSTRDAKSHEHQAARRGLHPKVAGWVPAAGHSAPLGGTLVTLYHEVKASTSLSKGHGTF